MYAWMSTSALQDFSFLFRALAPGMGSLPHMMASSLALLSVPGSSDTPASATVFVTSASEDMLLESPTVY